MTVASLALAHLLARCAPRVGPLTMSALVTYESGARPFAVDDDTARRSYAPRDLASARALATRLVAAGHAIDVGYAQVASANFARYGLDANRALEPCTNVAVGARILRAAYARAARTYGPGQLALAHALSAYNTGGFSAGLGYARRVYAVAADARRAPERRP